MFFWDHRIKKDWHKYLKQSFLAAILVLPLFFVLNIEKHSAIISTLGASIFIVFTVPHYSSSHPRRILGGYFFGSLIGITAYYSIALLYPLPYSPPFYFAPIATGIIILLMAVTSTEHPPAAGLAIGLIYNQWDLETLLTIWGSVIFLSLVRHFLEPWLINLSGTPKPQKEGRSRVLSRN